jgi:hypothetical protein
MVQLKMMGKEKKRDFVNEFMKKYANLNRARMGTFGLLKKKIGLFGGTMDGGGATIPWENIYIPCIRLG